MPADTQGLEKLKAELNEINEMLLGCAERLHRKERLIHIAEQLAEVTGRTRSAILGPRPDLRRVAPA
ncbi:MAG: hypothetical protein JO163_13860 [Methylobacteriaceae bacterium]|nr:hypothetical protein [Methylobacteriaceae bacterium]MBV9703809.1 hypothetical protein [Methylobacteriaceae bacterium]